MPIKIVKMMGFLWDVSFSAQQHWDLQHCVGFGASMENYCRANKEIWDLGAGKGINRRARKLGGNLRQGKGRERKVRAAGGGENNPPGGGWGRGKGGERLPLPEIPPK